MEFAVRDLEPNPFRDYDRYPIRPEKVAALRESLRQTGFWDNVVARQRNGKAELAYGHHRLKALRDEYGPDRKVSVIIRDLSDQQMLKIMARENMEEWGTSAWVEIQTVAAVIKAYGEGKIELDQPGSLARGVRSGPHAEPYTALTVATFLGWVAPSGRAQAKVENALAALDFIAEGLLDEDDFVGLTTKQAESLVEDTRREKEEHERQARRQERLAEQAREDEQRAQNEAERKQAQRRAQAAQTKAQQRRDEGTGQTRQRAKTVSEGLRTGKTGYKGVRDFAPETKAKAEGPPPDLWDVANRLAQEIGRLLDEDRDAERVRRLNLVTVFRHSLDDFKREDLALSLDQLARRAQSFAAKIRDRSSTVVELS